MTALRAKWTAMNWYRRGLSITMVLEILVFGVLTATAVSQPGVSYGDGFLVPRREGEVRIYEGTVDGEPARFTVSPGGEVSYRWGEFSYGPYRVSRDPAAVPEGFRGEETGLEIRRGDEVVFRGSYSPDSPVPLIDESGAPVWDAALSVEIIGEESTLYVDGRAVTWEERHAPRLAAVAEMALGPALTHRGSVGYYLLITLLAALNLLQICFPGFFFRLSLLGHVRNREAAEPSSFYIGMERLEWALLAALCLVLYIVCCTRVI